jgi:hypothetical protein
VAVTAKKTLVVFLISGILFLEVQVFWDVTLYRLANSYQIFRKSGFPPPPPILEVHHSNLLELHNPEMEELRFSEMSLTICQLTRYDVPEDLSLYPHFRKNLKSHNPFCL